MSRYKQQQNDFTADTELDSWPDEGRVRVYGPTSKRILPRTNLLSILAMSVILSICFGILVGYFGHAVHHPEDHCYSDTLVRLTSEAHDKITEQIIEKTSALQIKEYLSYLTKEVHVAGSEKQFQLAQYLQDEWRKHNLDDVKLDQYNVLLNYPDQSKPNKVSIIDTSGNVLWESAPFEKPLRYDENDPNTLPPFVAYSASGTVLGDLVYVNFATFEDFIYIQTVLNVSVIGKIGIARYGKNFRGDKIEYAQKFNMAGLILYSDPSEVAPYGYEDNETYPNSWYMPDSGVQRGTGSEINGDILTIGYPANPYMYRELPKKGVVPKIPSYPISYGDAIHLLRAMKGPEVPAHWRGGLNVTYRLGPGFQINDKQWQVKLEVNLVNERRNIYNVIGRINGSIEPDRYIILGNHRDAWTFGAVDPSSGTACLCETVRVLGQLHAQGWRPRRTIIFASWDAEEYTVVGSVEYVENNARLLKKNAVAYLNVDSSVFGNYSLRINSSPMLYQAAYDVAKLIPNPDPAEIAAGRPTVYDTWVHVARKDNEIFHDLHNDHTRLRNAQSNNNDPKNEINRQLPYIGNLGSGSDYLPFVNIIGIPSMDIRYVLDSKYTVTRPGLQKARGSQGYPLYHTRHDTFHAMATFIDPTFAFHRTISQYWSEMARYMADSYVLPLEPIHYGHAMRRFIHDIVQSYGPTILQHDISIDVLTKAISDFTRAAQNFDNANHNIFDIQKSDKLKSHSAGSYPAENARADPVRIRALNDKLMAIERGFLDGNGLPHNYWYKHMLMAPSSYNFYNGSGFPALQDMLYALQLASSVDGALEIMQSSQTNIFHTLVVQAAATYGSLKTPMLADPAYYEWMQNYSRTGPRSQNNNKQSDLLYYSSDNSFETSSSFASSFTGQLSAFSDAATVNRLARQMASLDFENPKPYPQDVAEYSKSMDFRSQKSQVRKNEEFNLIKDAQTLSRRDRTTDDNDQYSRTLDIDNFHRAYQTFSNGAPPTSNTRNSNTPSKYNGRRLLGFRSDKSRESLSILVEAIKKHITVLAYTIRSTADLFDD